MLSYDDYNPLSNPDSSFGVSIFHDDTGDTVLEDTAGEHSIGGWLLEDLGVPKSKKTRMAPFLSILIV